MGSTKFCLPFSELMHGLGFWVPKFWVQGIDFWVWVGLGGFEGIGFWVSGSMV